MAATFEDVLAARRLTPIALLRETVEIGTRRWRTLLWLGLAIQLPGDLAFHAATHLREYLPGMPAGRVAVLLAAATVPATLILLWVSGVVQMTAAQVTRADVAGRAIGFRAAFGRTREFWAAYSRLLLLTLIPVVPILGLALLVSMGAQAALRSWPSPGWLAMLGFTNAR